MHQINNITQIQINTHTGEVPVFDPAKDERVQFLEWVTWSARHRMIQALSQDQAKKAQGFDPDEGRSRA